MPSEHCQQVLQDLETGKIQCGDFRSERSAVMCLAFDIMRKENRRSLPVKEAWSKVKTKCRR